MTQEPYHTSTRDSHLCVTCRSICDCMGSRNTFLLGVDQGLKMNSGWLIPINQSTFLLILGRRGNAFILWTVAKSSDQGQFSPIKILDPSCKCFYAQDG